MEGLLHPVGPEDVRTYWIRRGGALAVLLVLVIGFGVIISNLGGTDGNAAPAETTAVPVPPPAQAADPVVTEAPPPAPAAPAKPGNAVPDGVTDAEAVPVPSSARTRAPGSSSATRGYERSSDDADSRPEPEPANTFYLNAPTPSPTR